MIYAYTKLYRVIRYGLSDDLELSFGNFLQVEAANNTEWFPVKKLKKLALIKSNKGNWLVFIPNFIDHK